MKIEDFKEAGIALLMILFVIGVWLYSWYWIDHNVLGVDKIISSYEARGTFGDKFGAVNALFSGLAFAGIIYTILLQRKELKLQREELEQTRDVFKEQNEMIAQQKFENTFFQMLSLFNSIVNNLYLEKDKRNYNGRDCFNIFYNEMEKKIAEVIFDRKNPNHSKWFAQENYTDISEARHNDIIDGYERLYKSRKSYLSHYFRTLYHLVKFVHESKIEDKKRYMSIIRSQLSSYEQLLFLYNCLHKNGNIKFKPLIEEYALLKNIDEIFLFKSLDEKIYDLYKGNAFGGSIIENNVN